MFTIKYEGGKEKVSKGETVLIPAELNEFSLVPEAAATFLEVYME